MVLGLPDLFKKQISMLGCIYAISSAIVFDLADILSEREAPLFWELAFTIIMLGMIALESLIFYPFFRKGLFEIPKKHGSESL